uniref:Leucine rich repeat containing 75A n=1 Tax=Ornithorhynchus anatinus TaxID=9258 RepID=A0A6I8N8J1_ORNAN
MGSRQTKGPAPESPPDPRTPRPRPHLWTSLLPRSGDKAGRSGGPGPASGPAPYQRRVGLIEELLGRAREGRRDQAAALLRHLRQDLGMESTSLDDVLYRYASFRNLVDPITHDLIISLARHIHCPKPVGVAGAGKKLCRQLTYHLSPHSQHCRRPGLSKRKPQAWLKAVLSGPPPDNTVDLSGIALSCRELDRLASYLQRCAAHVVSLELGFTDLTDASLQRLLPALAALPRLATLALPGNRLTRAALRHLTDALKDPAAFPCVTWIDLGNNVDIFSLPQPFLLALRKRCPQQGHLPTILEFGEGPPGSGDGEGPTDPGGLGRKELEPPPLAQT